MCTYAPMPDPEVYFKEFKYLPWGETINTIINFISFYAPKNANIIDIMCGPGYVLSSIEKQRDDLILTGVDINQDYLDYAKKITKKVQLIKADILEWKPETKYNYLILTAGLHHIPYEKQKKFLSVISNWSTSIIIGENFISSKEYKLAVAELNYSYLQYALRLNAPEEIITAIVDLFKRDIFQYEEYKMTLTDFCRNVINTFSYYYLNEMWIQFTETGERYGDFIVILEKGA